MRNTFDTVPYCIPNFGSTGHLTLVTHEHTGLQSVDVGFYLVISFINAMDKVLGTCAKCISNSQ